MSSLNNLYKKNLNKLLEIKKNDNLVIRNETILEIEKYKFYHYFTTQYYCDFQNINTILNQSFFQQLNHFQIVFTDTNQNEIEFEENKNNIIFYLENCIYGLKLFIETTQNNIILLELNNKFKLELEKFKNLKYEQFKKKELGDHFYYFNYDIYKNNDTHKIDQIKDSDETKENKPFYTRMYNYIIIKLFNILEFISRINF